MAILALGIALCVLGGAGVLALAVVTGRLTARARTPRQAVAQLFAKLHGDSGERVATGTFVFADLVGFTALTEARGDLHASRTVARFSRAVAKATADYGAYEVKSLGDGVMLRAGSAVEAVRLAVRIANNIGGNADMPDVRVGVHTGPAVERAGDWIGTTVNLAARVCAEARPGDVLVTDATVKAAGDDARVGFRFLGERRLRNFSSPVPMYRASDNDAGRRFPIPDPSGASRPHYWPSTEPSSQAETVCMDDSSSRMEPIPGGVCS